VSARADEVAQRAHPDRLGVCLGQRHPTCLATVELTLEISLVGAVGDRRQLVATLGRVADQRVEPGTETRGKNSGSW
jgi:hypothetical protein